MNVDEPCVKAAPSTATTRKGGSPTIPLGVYVLAVGTFTMLTTEFIVAGILTQLAAELDISVAQAGLLITVFAAGMVIGAPLMALLTLRLPQRMTLILALTVFAVGHVVVALGSDFTLLMIARFFTALATGAFWAIAGVVAAKSAGPGMASRALGIINAGGMLATVLGVPLGAFASQYFGWRGSFWGLAVLAVISALLIARHVPNNLSQHSNVSIRGELAGLRSTRLWLTLAACATTTGGVLATYSYISPLLIDGTGFSETVIPLVLISFGVGSLIGSLVGGRLGDAYPHLLTVIAPATSTLILLAICLLSEVKLPMIALVALLGFFGLGANPILASLAINYGNKAPTLASSLTVAGFNAGTVVASWAGSKSLESALGTTGPVVLGACVAALTLIPVITLSVLAKRSAHQELAHNV
ncbi:MFS transporter [Arthrobacter sp. NIO-1057]|uniref:MFS transporter n=1 Tax=Arthrobacter sp. NIO-1057 TaxID=993071 RepID=UPI00071E61E5|nr:MFS transporter [Arthrobacter sp. NIO-1057]KSU66391.1 MFS transporter [Arthrobacter sp. NIO-1057]SCC12873.1 MFS transporter, DHA1 family, arabinose polymer transporter [Arthrobacter sp. NIO-1057]